MHGQYSDQEQETNKTTHICNYKARYSKRTLSQNKTQIKKIVQLFSRELKVMLHGTIRNDDF